MEHGGWGRGVLLAGLPALLVAQDTGTPLADLTGQVRGPGSSARVEVLQRATGRTWRLACEASGGFSLRFLPPGTYRLKVEAPGWQVLELDPLVLRVGTEHRVNLEMVKAQEAGVVVAAAAQEGAVSATVVDAAQLQNLPLGRRSFADLSLSTPWALPGRGPVQAAAPDSRISFAGAGPRENTFLVDGFDHNDLGGGTLRAPIPQDAIQEFQVLGAGQGASYGRFLGGVVNAVTRSGGNTAQGGLSVFHRPASMDALPPAGERGTDLRMWQVGGFSSGPIVPDRLFYCVAAERLDQRDLSVVTLAPEALTALRGQGFQVETGSMARREALTSVSLKLDWLPAQDHTLSFTFLQAREQDDAQVPWGGLIARSAGGERDTRSWTLGIAHRWTPTGQWMVDSRLMKAVRDNRLHALDAQDTVQVDIQGAALIGTNRLTPQDTRADYVQGGLTVIGILGAHQVRGGIDLVETDNRGTVKQNFSGYYLFTALPPYFPTSLAAFQAGFPLAFLQAFGNPYTRFSTGSQGVFLEDTWEVGAWTLRAGLRWDRERLAPFALTPDFQALMNPPEVEFPPFGPIQLADGAIPYRQLFRVQTDWSSARLAPRLTLTWQARPDLVACFGWAELNGRTALGPLLGMRVSDGQQGFGIVRLLDAAAASWAGDGGKAPGRRYPTAPEGSRVITLPGAYRAPLSRQGMMSLAWTPRPGFRLTLDGLKSRTTGMMYLRDVNPVVAPAGIPRRPDLRYGSVYRVDGSGRSEHEAWSLGAQGTRGETLRLRASYTWRRSLDNMVDWTGVNPPQDTFHPEGEWGPGSDDRRHTFQLAGTWRPYPAWTLSALARLTSGRPYSRLAGADLNGNGDAATDRPAGIGRNSERLPWERRVDLRLSRAFRVQAVQLEAVLDVFNTFNTATVATVQNSLASVTPAFGTALTYDPMRQVQLGVRISY